MEIKKDDYKHIESIQKIVPLTTDDASHLSTAILNKCNQFVTIDIPLLKSASKINQRFKTKIKHPSEAFKQK